VRGAGVQKTQPSVPAMRRMKVTGTHEGSFYSLALSFFVLKWGKGVTKMEDSVSRAGSF